MSANRSEVRAVGARKMEHSTKEGPSYMLPEITELQGALAVGSTQSALANKRKIKGGAEGSCTRKKMH